MPSTFYYYASLWKLFCLRPEMEGSTPQTGQTDYHKISNDLLPNSVFL